MNDLATSLTDPNHSNKRPRSPSNDASLPPPKVPRVGATPYPVNYLVRQNSNILPLASTRDTLPEILRILGEYDGVIQRHESLAGNLGACPLGPILLKRFERLFDGPPRVLKANGRDANITWLDVVEFAQNKPEQFNLEKMRNGVRVCQFYNKQCRVEISEEDYVLIASGMPQKLIPPQPILEDEEKELGIMELVDRKLTEVIQLTDQVSARARQLLHRMKTRQSAIQSRRQPEGDGRSVLRSNDSPKSPTGPTEPPILNNPPKAPEPSHSPQPGFMAVNLRQPVPAETTVRSGLVPQDTIMSNSSDTFPDSSTQNVTIINGKSVKAASPTLRAELLRKFLSGTDREAVPAEEDRRSSFEASRPTQAVNPEHKRAGSTELVSVNYVNKHPSSVPIPSTPASLMPQPKPPTSERDDGGPYKVEMVGRMESMHRGERILPPCDRCRRLHMDCLKNLTACQGCTKKHAKCSWKDVRPEELATTRPSSDHGAVEVPDTVDEVTIPAGTTSEVGHGIIHGRVDRHESEVDEGPRDEDVSMHMDTVSKAAPEARFDVRPPRVPQQLQDVASGSPPRGQYNSRFGHHPPQRVRQSIESGDQEEGDRLQALAAQVYRSTSKSVRPSEG